MTNDQPRLPSWRETSEFEGADHDSEVSFIVTEAEPGKQLALHHHPYSETFVIQAGRVRFHVDGRIVDAEAGDVVVAPPGAVHGFLTLGPELARTVNVHASPRFETIWEENPAPIPAPA